MKLIPLTIFICITLCHSQGINYSARASCGRFKNEQCSFIDRFATFQTSLWSKSSGEYNGKPFNSWWAFANTIINKANRHLLLAVSKTRNTKLGVPYASGEIKSNGRYGYGCYEARMRPVAQPGVITGFFIYTDKFNALRNRPKRTNSINLGFLYQPSFNLYSYRMTFTKNGKQGPIQDVYPNFDVSKQFHNYGFKFTKSGITWYLDGFKVFSVTKNIPNESDGPFRIFVNTWIVSPSAGFGGKYVFRGRGVTRIAAIRYTRGVGCSFKKSF